MCGGGRSAPRAQIEVPDYRAYDRQFDLQKDAIERGMNSGTQALQAELQGVLRETTGLKEKLLGLEEQEATNQAALEEKATRLSLLMGTPPPEPNAQAPEIGAKDRGLDVRKGKKSLRIRQASAQSSAKGTGLNIT
jgi:outer membrane protein TolC